MNFTDDQLKAVFKALKIFISSSGSFIDEKELDDIQDAHLKIQTELKERGIDTDTVSY